jgi:23S rRNA (pseudouridine1915-N3)-methyltransferase
LVIIIGGAYGVGEELKFRANYTLSLGKMVWPHALARVMLLEQLYRAHTILANVPYHNE